MFDDDLDELPEESEVPDLGPITFHIALLIPELQELNPNDELLWYHDPNVNDDEAERRNDAFYERFWDRQDRSWQSLDSEVMLRVHTNYLIHLRNRVNELKA